MSSTYSTDLRIELITTGEQAGVWGVTTNNNLSQVIEQAIAGYVSVSITSADQALTYTNGGASTGAANQSVYAMIALTTALSTSFRVYVPPSSKMYTFYNASTRTATIYNSTSIGNTTAAGTGAIVLAGSSITVWSDGTNVRPQIFNNWDLGTGSPVAAQRYIQVTNTSADSAATAAANVKSDVQNLQILATSSTASPVSGIPLAGKASLYAAGGVGSSGLQIWDRSDSPQIDFIIGTTVAGTINSSGNWSFNSKTISGVGALTASSFIPNGSSVPTNGMYLSASNVVSIANNSAVTASFTSAGNFDVGTNNSTNAARFVRALNASTGSSAFASVYSQSDVQIAQLISNSSTFPAASGIALAGKAAIYIAGGAGSTGLQIWDNSASPQIDFIVGTNTVAGTINSSGNWSFNSKTLSGVGALTASSFTPSGSSVPTNGMYLSGTNVVTIATNSLATASFTSTNNFDVGALNAANAARFIQVSNTNAGSSATAAANVKSDVQNLQILATSSTASPVSGIPLAGKASLYAAGGVGSSGLQIWDRSDSPQIDFIIGTTVAGTINSSGNWNFNSKTLSSATWNGAAIGAAYGGTGVANNSANTITFSGNYPLALTLSGSTSVTLPTSGTLLSTAAVVTSSQGGTGVANNAANTLTFSGAYPLALTLSASTSLTMPTSGTLVSSGAWTTYTPVVYFVNGTTYTVVSSGTYRQARYLVVGNMVYVQFYVNFLGGTGTGYNIAMSLPVACAGAVSGFPANGTYGSSGMVACTYNLSTTQTGLPYPDPGTTNAFFAVPSGAAGFPGFAVMPASGGATIYGIFSYTTT